MENFIFRSTQENQHPSLHSHPPNLNKAMWCSSQYRYLGTAM